MPPRDHCADVVLFLPQHLRGQHPAKRLLRRRERPVLGRFALHAPQRDGRRADADFLARPELRALRHGLVVDERAVAAAEILDERVVEIERELRVPPRDEFGLDADAAVGIAPDDIFARREGQTHMLRTSDGDEDLGLRGGHGDG